MLDVFQEEVDLKFQLYNSLFLTLPFGHIRQTGNYLPLLSKACEEGFAQSLSPEIIIDRFFGEYFPDIDSKAKQDILFNFIQYIERQVVLFDSVEDAAFAKVHDLKGPGTLSGLFSRSKMQRTIDALHEKLQDFSLRIVLTAHPTQFYPGSILGIITDLNEAIQSNRVDHVSSYLRQLGKTPFLKKEKPTPYDEAISLIWYLENVFYEAVSDVVYRLESELQKLGKPLEVSQLIELGFWPGGDRDGNPFVNAEITKKVAKRLRRTIYILYFRDIRTLKRRLTFPGVYDKMHEIERKLYNGINQVDDTYLTQTQLLDDLAEIEEILVTKHQSLFLTDFHKMQSKVKIFGLHLAIIDVRQDSSEIEDLYTQIVSKLDEKSKAAWSSNDLDQQLNVLNALKPEDLNLKLETKVNSDTLESHKLMQEIQATNGLQACHRYIISNSQAAVHVFQIFYLAKVLRDDMHVDIVPLFETIEDLKIAANEMKILYSHNEYRDHLRSRNDKQTIMLGFSDGTKDGGYLSANWSIYQAKEALTKVSREFGIRVSFFDGRGGPPARGGGNTHKFYASLGNRIEDNQVQVTIQGQTISSNFGTTDSAKYNIEQLLTAGVENSVFKGDAKELDAIERQILNELSDISLETYVNFKNHPKFLLYLEEMGTLPYYGATNIGSRPVKRAGSGKLTLQKLRAIPFVGSWSQMKQNVPGYFGLGTALEVFKHSGRLDKVKALYRRSLFFQTLIQNSMQSLCKCYFPLTAYLEDHEEFGEIWKIIHSEYQRSMEMLLYISDEKTLLEFSPNTKSSIALREKMVLPLLTIQQYALAKSRSKDKDEDMYHKMVLRTMFGIINAGRNSA